MDRNHRRKFGQNFLVNPGLVEDMVSDIPFRRGDPVLEIGPGHGAMTGVLLRAGADLTAVEIDPGCVKYLKFKMGKSRLKLVKQDFLDFPLAEYLKENPGACICGNLPYNKGTPILRQILPHLKQSGGVMAMVQLEVAKRLSADPGNKNYGFLSVLLRSYASARLLRRIESENFRPRPKVMSATVFIEYKKTDPVDEEFLRFAMMCFSKKRKMLYNSLDGWYSRTQVKDELTAMKLDSGVRAEALSETELQELFRKLGAPVTPGS